MNSESRHVAGSNPVSLCTMTQRGLYMHTHALRDQPGKCGSDAFGLMMLAQQKEVFPAGILGTCILT